MTRRAGFLAMTFLAGCATAAPEPAADPGVVAAPEAAPETTAPPTVAAGPSDWALAIVGTPFVFAFRAVTCAATAVVAAPTAGLVALSEERAAGLEYLRWGLAENCDGPYVVPVPVADRYDPDPYVAGPRPLARYGDDRITTPRHLTAAAPDTTED